MASATSWTSCPASDETTNTTCRAPWNDATWNPSVTGSSAGRGRTAAAPCAAAVVLGNEQRHWLLLVYQHDVNEASALIHAGMPLDNPERAAAQRAGGGLHCLEQPVEVAVAARGFLETNRALVQLERQRTETMVADGGMKERGQTRC